MEIVGQFGVNRSAPCNKPLNMQGNLVKWFNFVEFLKTFEIFVRTFCATREPKLTSL